MVLLRINSRSYMKNSIAVVVSEYILPEKPNLRHINHPTLLIEIKRPVRDLSILITWAGSSSSLMAWTVSQWSLMTLKLGENSDIVNGIRGSPVCSLSLKLEENLFTWSPFPFISLLFVLHMCLLLLQCHCMVLVFPVCCCSCCCYKSEWFCYPFSFGRL